jgi:hypothetical protein
MPLVEQKLHTRPSFVSIGLVVSEEKIFEKVYDVRRTASDGKSSRGLWPGELKTKDRVTRIPLKTDSNRNSMPFCM